MGFDANSADQPILNVRKKTTQVNLWMAVGVAFFLAICFALISWSRHRNGADEHNPPEQRQSR